MRSLDREVQCVACGYNLRGLLPTGNCPECGELIAPSLRTSLQYANVGWLQSIRDGVRLLIACWMLHVIVSGIGLGMPTYTMAVVPLAIVTDCILLAAVFKITRREPFAPASLDLTLTRRFSRFVVFLVVLNVSIISIPFSLQLTSNFGFNMRILWLPLLSVLLWIHLGRLARRDLQPELVSDSSRMVKTIIFCSAATFVLIMGVGFFRWSGATVNSLAGSLIMLASMAILFTSLVLQVFVLSRYRRMLDCAITVRPYG